MRAKFLKLLTCLIICGCIGVFLSKTSYCDQKTYQHIHIRGKVTDANNQPVSGVKLKIEREGNSSTAVLVPFVTGLSASSVGFQAEATESGPGGAPCTYTTAADGSYHIIIKVHEERGYPPPDTSLIRIDRSKMAWEKGGYTIKPK